LLTGWLVHDYISPKTKEPLALGSVHGYWGRIMTIAKTLFKGDAFMALIDDDRDCWYTRMRSNIERTIVHRCMDNAESVSDKATPIGRDDMMTIAEAYFSHGTKDSIMRQAALSTDYSASGRGSDVQTATWNLYTNDRISKLYGFEWYTKKTSTRKHVFFVRDYENIYIDHYFVMACLLLTGSGQDDWQGHSGNNQWIFSDLKAKNISIFLQDLEPNSKNVEYKRSRVPSLPTGLSSNSLRIGTLSELMSRNVSNGVIALHGGHAGEKAKEAKNMWEYQPATCQTILPGIINFL
jgi:hypothetical protein